jgi:hypothetical protein
MARTYRCSFNIRPKGVFFMASQNYFASSCNDSTARPGLQLVLNPFKKSLFAKDGYSKLLYIFRRLTFFYEI